MTAPEAASASSEKAAPRASWREGLAVYLQRRVLIVLLLDALHVPFFTRKFGRRRGWLVFSQLLLIGAILLLALTDPALSPLFVALGALLVAAMSSTQDIVVDAFRVESLPESEQAAGMASYVAAYRIGMLVSTAGAL